jgi:hypothetical protein
MLEVTMQDNTAHSNGFDQDDCPYVAGDTIQQSGLYEICHHDEPRTKVVLVVNGVFPFCRRCGDKVRYKLVQPVPHISEDPDFNEFFGEPYNPSTESSAPKLAVPIQLGLAYGFRFCQDPVPAWRESPEAGDL